MRNFTSFAKFRNLIPATKEFHTAPLFNKSIFTKFACIISQTRLNRQYDLGIGYTSPSHKREIGILLIDLLEKLAQFTCLFTSLGGVDNDEMYCESVSPGLTMRDYRSASDR